MFTASAISTNQGNLGEMGTTDSVNDALFQASTIARDLGAPVNFTTLGAQQFGITVHPEDHVNYLAGRWTQLVNPFLSPVFTRAEFERDKMDIQVDQTLHQSPGDAIQVACDTARIERRGAATQFNNFIFVACIDQSPEFLKGCFDQKISSGGGPIRAVRG